MSKKIVLILGLLVFGSLILATACSESETDEKTQNNETTEQASIQENSKDTAIKKVDFKNFSYPISLDEGEKGENSLTLKDGKLKKNKDGMEAELSEIQYADLTDDKQEEALINLQTKGDKDAKSNLVYVYTIEKNKPKLLWSFESLGGEKVGIKELQADNGKLLVEFYGDVKFNDGQFETLKSKDKTGAKYSTTELKWNGKTFEAVAGDKEEKKTNKTKTT